MANIPARITLHELLRLLKETREALRDVFTDSESFLTRVPCIPTDDNGASCPQCHMVQQVSCITFTFEDMLLRDNRHNRPLYYSEYGSKSRSQLPTQRAQRWIGQGDSDRSRTLRAKCYIESSKNSEKITTILKKCKYQHSCITYPKYIA